MQSDREDTCVLKESYLMRVPPAPLYVIAQHLNKCIQKPADLAYELTRESESDSESESVSESV